MSVLAAAEIGVDGDGVGLEFLVEGVEGFIGRDAADSG
jgi:hypothetical protein